MGAMMTAALINCQCENSHYVEPTLQSLCDAPENVCDKNIDTNPAAGGLAAHHSANAENPRVR